jgi:hypothetical protein
VTTPDPQIVPPKDARVQVGVLVAQSPARTAWGEPQWRPHSVLLGGVSFAPWTELRREDDTTIWYAGEFPVSLFVAETVTYRMNLAEPIPSVYVVLRRDPSLPPPGIVVRHVTVSPGEAEAYAVDGEHIVEKVPMPEALMAWLGDYVRAYHVEEAFKKRKRTRIDPSKGFGKGAEGNDYSASFAQKENNG